MYDGGCYDREGRSKMEYVKSHQEEVACGLVSEGPDGAQQCALRHEMKEEEIRLRGVVLKTLNDVCLV